MLLLCPRGGTREGSPAGPSVPCTTMGSWHSALVPEKETVVDAIKALADPELREAAREWRTGQVGQPAPGPAGREFGTNRLNR